MRKALALVLLLGSARALAKPAVRVAVASFIEARPGWKGPVTADEAADRLALLRGWAVADREHVREAEKQLGLADADPQHLVALGKRLRAELVVGGRLDGAALHAIVVAPESGAVDKLEVTGAGARPDQVAARLAVALRSQRHGDAAALALSALEAVDGDDRAWEKYGPAREKFYAGDFAAAQQGLEAALALDAKLARARALYASVKLKLKDYAGADAPARAALDTAPALREVRLAFARVQDFNRRTDAAIEAYQSALAVASEDAVAHSNLARLYAVEKRDHASAAREYQAAIDDEPAWALPAFNLALSQLELGRAADAVKALDELHQRAPTDDKFTRALARALRRADRPSAAIPLLQPIAAQSPLSRAELALALADAGRADEALAALDQAGPDQNKSTLLRTARGRVLLQKHDLEAAARVLDEGRAGAATDKPLDRHELLKTLAVVQLARGKAAEAAQALKPVLDEDPLDGEALYDLGLALAAQHDPSATNQLEKATHAAPWLTAPALALGSIRLAAGDAAGAAQAYRAALAAGADDARLHLGLGVARWRAGALDEAAAELEQAAQAAQPDVQADAAYDLTEVLWAARRRDEARRAAERYLAVEKRDRTAWRERARKISGR